MHEQIKIFLESPKTQELANDNEIAFLKNKIKIKTVRAKKRKFPKTLSKLANRSIFYETDFSKLTDRQKILVARFQQNTDRLNPMFMVANNLENMFNIKAIDMKQSSTLKKKSNICKCKSDIKKLDEFLNWLKSRHNCKVNKSIINLQCKVNHIMNLECICDLDDRIYKSVVTLTYKKCCNTKN